ncbi:MAG: hypothetical protein ACJ75Z_10025 [Solirubrobacterales bacterium]
MRRLLSRRPTPAMIVAVIALIAALGGTAVAGGFLTKKKFHKQLSQFRAEVVRGPLTYVSTDNSVASTGPFGAGMPQGVHVTADCPAGTRVTGGGIKVANGANMQVTDSYATVNGWAGTVFNSAGQPQAATVVAICAVSQNTRGQLPVN